MESDDSLTNDQTEMNREERYENGFNRKLQERHQDK